MTILIIVVACIAAAAGIVFFSAALATKIVYGFHWKAICGFVRQANRKHVMYVSRGPFNPTAVYWLGSKDWQEEAVASAIAEGRIPRADYAVVNRKAYWSAMVNEVDVWPTSDLKNLLGKPNDVSADTVSVEY